LHPGSPAWCLVVVGIRRSCPQCVPDFLTVGIVGGWLCLPEFLNVSGAPALAECLGLVLHLIVNVRPVRGVSSFDHGDLLSF
jgi:hypothetical protein